jgi:hypothetical protein
VFTPTHDAFWTACRRRHGDAKGTRALIEVLLAHRYLPADALVQAMRLAVDAGVTDPAVVVVEARRLADRPAGGDRQPSGEVIPIGALARFDRPSPGLAGYDTLLAGDGRETGERAHRSGPGSGSPLEVVGGNATAEAAAAEVGV